MQSDRSFARLSPAVWFILALCAVPEALFAGAELGLWAGLRLRIVAIDFFAFWAGLLGSWQPNYALQPWLMFLTYGFLHGGPVHFLVNMATLLSLGDPIARAIGQVRFLGLYLAFQVAGAIGFALWPEVGAPMVGASGALFGLAGLLLAWDFQDRRAHGHTIAPVARSLGMLFLLNLLLWWAMDGQLAWQTHLGGFVAGWLAARWVQPAA
jgi:membrane associated rhomboid family serine protease